MIRISMFWKYLGKLTKIFAEIKVYFKMHFGHSEHGIIKEISQVKTALFRSIHFGTLVTLLYFIVAVCVSYIYKDI